MAGDLNVNSHFVIRR